MERKITERLMAWKKDPLRKALLLKGLRQTGKTHILTEFVKLNYESYIFVDLEDNDKVRAVFEQGNLSASEIIDRLVIDTGVSLTPGRSAIVLDEIQACLPAYSALKPLAADGRFDILASGSLLGVRIWDLQRRSPMGYVNIMELKPLDFEEFLWAMGIERTWTEYLRTCISERNEIDPYICKRANDLFRRYMVVGGMPAAVETYSKTRDYAAVKRVLDDILSIVRADVERYSKGADRIKISQCLESIPGQLEDETTDVFRYSRIEKSKGGFNVYGRAIEWLKKTGLVLQCQNLTEPVSPLMTRVRPSSFKLMMADTGLLTAMLEPDVAGDIVNRDPYSNNGSVMENAIACALDRAGYPLMFYKRPNSTLEVDFVANIDGDVTAIEVKSGRNTRAKSLYTLFVREHTVKRAMKLSDGNVFIDRNGIENYPLFGPCFFKRSDDVFMEPLEDMDDLKAAFEAVTRSEREG